MRRYNSHEFIESLQTQVPLGLIIHQLESTRMTRIRLDSEISFYFKICSLAIFGSGSESSEESRNWGFLHFLKCRSLCEPSLADTSPLMLHPQALCVPLRSKFGPSRILACPRGVCRASSTPAIRSRTAELSPTIPSTRRARCTWWLAWLVVNCLFARHAIPAAIAIRLLSAGKSQRKIFAPSY